jgi:hypothetical protein
MKRTLTMLACAAFFVVLSGGSANALAADAAAPAAPAAAAPTAAAAPDCAEKQKALDEANAAAKTAAAPADLASCQEMKGKEKTACEKPLKEKAKTDAKAAKDQAKTAKTALDCCKNPKKKGCSS